MNDSYSATSFGSFIIAALGLSLVSVPFVALALSRVRQADSGVASSVVNVATLVGGSAGIAALGTVAWTIAAHQIHLTRAGGRADLPPRAPVDCHCGKTVAARASAVAWPIAPPPPAPIATVALAPSPSDSQYDR